MGQYMDKVFFWLLSLTPIAIAAHFLHLSELAVFFIAALAIIPLAKFLGEATEELASRSGPAFGGLLNATFGNATEIIIAIFALRAGLIEVVKASLTGSIIGNLLLVLGTAIMVGGVRHKKQVFNRTGTMASASMLLLAAIALTIPTFLSHSARSMSPDKIQSLSTTVAIFMFIVYIANLVFIFVTHKHLYTEEVGKYEANWSLRKSLLVLLGSTVAIAFLSEMLVGAIKPAMASLGWTDLFMGTVVIAIIGNAAEHFSAIVMAAKNRMDLSLQIAVGSAIQIAMFALPILVFISLIIGKSMNLVFTPFELAAIVLSVMLTNLVVQDGESNWLEGAQLISAYAIIAVAFYLHP
ncbi:MAG: putative H+/Ca2+ exchanging protein [Candidatus Saccharibacteria bacterium]|nr:putative H+/Ca2+ exchanging protein [Candidatus Saccharibacteria bacterium]